MPLLSSRSIRGGAWNTAHDKQIQAERRLKEIAGATPRIAYDMAKHAPITLGSGIGSRIEVWELWFRNRPSVQATTAAAKSLTAEITFCDN